MVKKKYSRKSVDNTIAKIRTESKERLITIDKPYKESKERFKKVLTRAEKETIDNPQKYKRELREAEAEERRLRKQKPLREARKWGVKTEAVVHTALEGSLQKIKQFSKKKIKVRKVLKPSRMVVEIQEPEQVEDKSVYFKSEMEDAKDSMFFS